MKTRLILLASIISSSVALAAPQTFDFKDPKGVNNVVFKLDAPLESINGAANGITGTVTFDPEKPGATKGKIVVSSASLTVPNGMMNTFMHKEEWLDSEKYPEISFEAKEFKNVKTTGDTTTAEVTGTFTLKGVAKEITAPVKLTYLKDKLGARLQGMPGAPQGDLLVVRATFNIKRADFNVAAGKYADKVAETIELTLSIAGASPK